MPRPRNDLKTEPVPISTTPHVVSCLRELMKTGFYGKNAPEVAERLLARTLEEMVASGKIKAPRRRG
jgi:hypothetical protein